MAEAEAEQVGHDIGGQVEYPAGEGRGVRQAVPLSEQRRELPGAVGDRAQVKCGQRLPDRLAGASVGATLVHPDQPGKAVAGAAAGDSTWYRLPGGTYQATRVIEHLLDHCRPRGNPQSQIRIEIQLRSCQQVPVIRIGVGMAGGGDGVGWIHGRFCG
jgi:hypothetical protein